MKKALQVPYRRLITALILFWGPVILFVRLAGEVKEHEPIGVDAKILEWVHSFSTTFMDRFAMSITNAGSAEVVVVLTLVLVGYLAFKKRRRNAALILFGVGGAAAANIILKMLFQRERPELWPHLVTENGYSFPSGHAMASSALAFSIVFILWHTKWRWLAVPLAALYILAIGFSRLYLGVHYPSDIVAGWCVSFAWVLIVYMNLHWALPKRHQGKTVATEE